MAVITPTPQPILTRYNSFLIDKTNKGLVDYSCPMCWLVTTSAPVVNLICKHCQFTGPVLPGSGAVICGVTVTKDGFFHIIDISNIGAWQLQHSTCGYVANFTPRINPPHYRCGSCNTVFLLSFEDWCTACLNNGANVLKKADYVCTNPGDNHTSDYDKKIQAAHLRAGKCDSHSCSRTCQRK